MMQSPQGGSIGGSEVQYNLLARELANRYDIAVVTKPLDVGSVLRTDLPFQVFAQSPYAVRGGALLRGASYLRSTWRALSQANADAHVQTGSGVLTAVTALFCAVKRKPFIYHWASDMDRLGPPGKRRVLIRLLFRLARRSARLQICQTVSQVQMLPAAQARRATVVPNALDTSLKWKLARGKKVVWIAGNSPIYKRPDRLVLLARALPHRNFVLVGNPGKPSEFGSAGETSDLPPNLEYLGRLPREKIPDILAEARIHINTSDVEGFPNTFLEAFASGVPVVSLNFDPNGTLSADGAGIACAGSMDTMARAIETLFEDSAHEHHRRAALRVAKNHLPGAIAKQFGDEIEKVLRTWSSPNQVSDHDSGAGGS